MTPRGPAPELGFLPVISVAAVRHMRSVGGHFLGVEFAALVWDPNDLHDLIGAKPTPHLMVRLLDKQE